jgi:hypothetical protein
MNRIGKSAGNLTSILNKEDPQRLYVENFVTLMAG